MFDFARERTALHSAYPERHTPREGWWDVQGSRLISPVIRWRRVRRCLSTNVVERVSERGRILARQSDEQLSQQAGELRERLRRGGLSEELVYRAFSLVREVAERTIGQRHYDVQILGGWVLLNGCIAEMATGEGKTLMVRASRAAP